MTRDEAIESCRCLVKAHKELDNAIEDIRNSPDVHGLSKLCAVSQKERVDFGLQRLFCYVMGEFKLTPADLDK